MAILTINWPNIEHGKPVTVPGIAGDLFNGGSFDVGDQLPYDLTLGQKPDQEFEVVDPELTDSHAGDNDEMEGDK